MPRNAARRKRVQSRAKVHGQAMLILSKNPFYLLANFGGWQLSIRSTSKFAANDNALSKRENTIELTAEEEEILFDVLG